VKNYIIIILQPTIYLYIFKKPQIRNHEMREISVAFNNFRKNITNRHLFIPKLSTIYRAANINRIFTKSDHRL